MRPIILHGHSRPITRVKYNVDGDLLFSASVDSRLICWSSKDGDLLGSYIGHKGVVTDFDINPQSTRVISGSADLTVKLWDLLTGQCLRSWTFESPVRSVAFIPKLANKVCILTDNKMKQLNTARILDLDDDEANTLVFYPSKSNLVNAIIVRWGPDNTLYMGHEDGMISCWDAVCGTLIASKQVFDQQVQDIQFHEDLTHFITCSKDMSAKIVDLALQVIKTYKTDRPINSAAMCPIKDHIILGGGQDASKVTTTSSKQGKFDSRLFHKILGVEFARIKGHFGPINSIAVHPDGTSFSTGAEEAYIRIHHFDPEYFTFKLDPRDS